MAAHGTQTAGVATFYQATQTTVKVGSRTTQTDAVTLTDAGTQTDAAAAPGDSVGSLLRSFRLEMYVQAFDDEGYDDLDYLRELPAAALRSVAADCGMKPGHAAKFVTWMQALPGVPPA